MLDEVPSGNRQDHASKWFEQREGQHPEKPGRRTHLPEDAERQLANFICALRSMKIPVFMHTLMTYANAMIKGTEFEVLFAKGQVSRGWYYGFLERHGFSTGNQRPLEMDRAMWCTSKNMEQHYKILAETFVACGVAVPNPEYDSSIPFDPASKSSHSQLSCQPILINNKKA